MLILKLHAAEKAAIDIGCEGCARLTILMVIRFGICLAEQHSNQTTLCWEGYQQDGWKMKDGKRVPNCVKKK